MAAGVFWESNFGAVCGARCDGFRLAAARGNDVDGCGGGTDGTGCAVGRTSGLVDFDWRNVYWSWPFRFVVMNDEWCDECYFLQFASNYS